MSFLFSPGVAATVQPAASRIPDIKQGYEIISSPDTKTQIKSSGKDESSDDVKIRDEAKLLASSPTVIAPSSVFRRAKGRKSRSMMEKLGKGDKLFNSGFVPDRTIKSLDNKPYSFIKSGNQIGAFFSSVAVETYYSATFTSAAISDFSSYAGVFDQYKLAQIEMWILPRLSVTDGTVVNSGTLTSVVDYDDATTITQAASYEYENVLSGPSTNGHYRNFKPHVAVASWGGMGSFGQFTNIAAPWIDCASTSAIHYGVKAVVSVTSIALYFDVQWRILVQFRNVR